MRSRDQLLSIVVPLNNEDGNVQQLHREIVATLHEHQMKGEIIFVDDGSVDQTVAIAKTLAPLKLIVFRRNFGQTAAMDAGIKAATGQVIVTMDGDLQNDPADIPRLLDKMDEGFDVVSGWRKDRKDPFSKRFLSRGADWLRKFLINDQVHDSGCSLKVYRRECFDQVDLYGEMHRFIPAVLRINGFRVGELVVNHRPRVSGNTKYNYTRLLKGFLDALSVWFWRKYAARPLHLFGGIGFMFMLMSGVITVWMFYDRAIRGIPLGGRIWLMVGIFLFLAGIQFLVSGLLTDIAVKTYHGTKGEKVYRIREEIVNG